jgi:hypothetical protein
MKFRFNPLFFLCREPWRSAESVTKLRALFERALPSGSVLCFWGWIGSGWVELAGELHRPEDFDHPFEVVSHDGEADFGLRAASSAQQ